MKTKRIKSIIIIQYIIYIANKETLEDDLSAFYAGMGSILSSKNDKNDAKADIFSVPKIQ